MDGIQAKKTQCAGMGVFATRSFDPGDLIWEETPLVQTEEILSFQELEQCHLHAGSDANFRLLRNKALYMRTFVTSSNEVQAKILNQWTPDRNLEKSFLWKHVASASKVGSEVLYPEYSEETLQDVCLIFMANQYPGSGETGLLFETGTMFNHHCRANATFIYDEGRYKGRWHALRPIVPGEEICISYVYPHYPTFWRQNQLMHRYLFLCRCSKCLDGGDLNRQILCTACHPRSKNSGEPAEIASITKGFFTNVGSNSGLETWVCDCCGIERITSGVPPLLETQLCVDVQMMMRRWEETGSNGASELCNLALGVLGPKHFCYIYSLQAVCNAMIKEQTTNFEELIINVKKIVDWVEEREAGFPGFHLQRFLHRVVQWCVTNGEGLDACKEFMKLTKPWVYMFCKKDNVEEWSMLEMELSRT